MSDLDKASPELQQLVADVDTGGRTAGGAPGMVIFIGAVGWALFQLWYASPLPFMLGFGVLNDTEARAIHLGTALFLAFLAFPATRRSPRDRIPLQDWALALAAAFAGAYLMLFYRELATRPGQPTAMDVATACAGLVLLLEATRRAVGLPMAILGIVFLGYVFLGPWLPDVIAHKGASLERMASHMWLTTEGVYGVALGVSVAFIYIFVLFGALLDRAGGGNYMMQVSFALLGHLRGGPAKVAVVSSALNGLISGSSVSNVVTGGIFTIPLMKKAGYGGVKAGAIETASSINGQIMPPVMGAAAFLMVEYVGIPYVDIIRHALLPAVISYIALFYIVHLEAVKLGIRPMAMAQARTARQKFTGRALGISGTIAVMGAVYWIAIGARALLGAAAPWVLIGLLAGLYVWLLRVAARSPDLPEDIDVNNPVLPQAWPTVRAGLYYLIPIGVLIWCLAVDELSPALSAFWATVTMIVLMLTQRPLLAFFRGRGMPLQAWKDSANEVVQGLNDGSRNMIGIGIATATAGIIVGGITLTGLGFRMTDFVELVSQGNVILMLLFTAFVCLVLGLGVPTTANYVLMASLMAPVIVELGAQSGLVIPLIAVHLFVFYYGIMADVTPPAGLATFAAAAISGEDPIRTGVQGSLYAMRTVVLPFVFVFNPALLMIDVRGWWEIALVALTATLASLTFAAATMGWFRTRCRWWEVLLLLVATFLLFRPDWVVDQYAAPYSEAPASRIFESAEALGEKERLVLQIHGTNIEGDEVRKTVAVQLDEAGPGRERLQKAGLTVTSLGEQVRIANVRFGSQARKSGFEPGWEVAAVMVPSDRPSAYWIYLPATLLVLLLWWGQGRRARAEPLGAKGWHDARVALIHALAHSVAPINEEMARAWPACQRMNLLDDSLSADLARSGRGLDEAMHRRFETLSAYAEGTGARGILFTCSAFGPCIEAAAARRPHMPVLKPNEAMIADAARSGGRVGLIASFAPTLRSMPPEFPAAVPLRTRLAEGALQALDEGRVQAHDEAVLHAARALLAEGCEVIALAQFSMARAAPLLRRELPAQVPVLTTPGSAVRALRERIREDPDPSR